MTEQKKQQLKKTQKKINKIFPVLDEKGFGATKKDEVNKILKRRKEENGENQK